MLLLRRVIGDALRARRQAQHRTLREVSGAANVSLGYLSEIERGQKEASSELLSAICGALGAQLSDLLREVSDMLALAELTGTAELTAAELTGADLAGAAESGAVESPVPAAHADVTNFVGASMTVSDGPVSVEVHREGPLKTTLRATRAGGRSLRAA